jgi:hypothetical protein
MPNLWFSDPKFTVCLSKVVLGNIGQIYGKPSLKDFHHVFKHGKGIKPIFRTSQGFFTFRPLSVYVFSI